MKKARNRIKPFPYKLTFRVNDKTLYELYKLSESRKQKHSEILRQALSAYLKVYNDNERNI